MERKAWVLEGLPEPWDGSFLLRKCWRNLTTSRAAAKLEVHSKHQGGPELGWEDHSTGRRPCRADFLSLTLEPQGETHEGATPCNWPPSLYSVLSAENPSSVFILLHLPFGMAVVECWGCCHFPQKWVRELFSQCIIILREKALLYGSRVLINKRIILHSMFILH